MKKKIVALILMLALVSTFFVGCSLFETDANRDYHQVVANEIGRASCRERVLCWV